jgi:hypothetical protein
VVHPPAGAVGPRGGGCLGVFVMLYGIIAALLALGKVPFPTRRPAHVVTRGYAALPGGPFSAPGPLRQPGL